MPQYLFYTVDEDGQFDEYIGAAEAPNSYQALGMASDAINPFNEFDPEMVEAVSVNVTLSGEDIMQGTV